MTEPLPGARSARALADMFSLDHMARTISVRGSTIFIDESTVDGVSSWVYRCLHTRNAAKPSNGLRQRDVALERRIADAVADPGVTVPCEAQPSVALPCGLTAVKVHGVTVVVEDVQVKSVGPGHAVTLPGHRPTLTPGFFMLVREVEESTPAGSQTRFYIPCATPNDAVAVWGHVIPALLQAGLSFRAKVLSQETLFPRADAIVVYARRDARAIAEKLKTCLAHKMPTPEASLLAVPVIEGVLYKADSPTPQTGQSERSFGEHRSRAIAEALWDAAQASDTDLHSRVILSFKRNGIDATDAAASVSVDLSTIS